MKMINILLDVKNDSAEVTSSALIGMLIKLRKILERNMLYVFITIIFLLIQPALKAQPVQVELNSGTAKYSFNSLISGFLDDNIKFQFYNITIFNQYHHSENKVLNGGINHAYFYRNFSSRFGLGAGATIHQIFGIIPKAAFQYLFVDEDFFLRIGPAITYNEQLGWELLLNLAYAIQLNRNYKIKSEIRSINSYTKFKKHNRSISQIKVGIPFEAYTLGIETSLDQIGPERDIISSLGIFIQYQVK